MRTLQLWLDRQWLKIVEPHARKTECLLKGGFLNRLRVAPLMSLEPMLDAFIAYLEYEVRDPRDFSEILSDGYCHFWHWLRWGYYSHQGDPRRLYFDPQSY